MLRFCGIYTSLFLPFILMSSYAFCSEAAVTTKTKLTSDAYRASWDLLFRGGMTSHDDGFDTTADYSPARHTYAEIALLRIGLSLSGLKSDFRFELQPLETQDESLIRIASISYAITHIVNLQVGRQLTLQGGWEVKDPPLERVALSNYFARAGKSSGAPFQETAPAVGLSFNLGDIGDLTLQAIDDVTTKKNPAVASFNTDATQPTVLVQYAPVPRPVACLLQMGTYDGNHSKYFMAGLRADLGRSHTTIDYTFDMRAVQSEPEPWIQRISNISVLTSYDFKNAMTPFFKYSNFESRKEGETLEPNRREVGCRGNACETTNAHETTAGIWFAIPTLNVKPYVIYTLREGRFRDNESDDVLVWKRETVVSSGLSVRL